MLRELDLTVAIASRSLSNSGVFSQIMSGIKWGTVYALNKEDGQHQGRFFMNMFDEETFYKLFEFSESKVMKRMR